MTRGPQSPAPKEAGWLFAPVIRVVISPLFLSFTGFHTTDFVLSGVYTWPRSSRVVALTFAVLVFSYEFVYKEQQRREPGLSTGQLLQKVFYFCAIPYMVGSLGLLVLLSLAK